MSWKAIAFSEASTNHQKSGQTCQDYAKFIKLNDFGETVNDGDIIIGAVSKGSEGCKHSNIGSQLAVETALNYLQDRIKFVGVNEAQKNCLLDISKEEADLAVRQFFLQTVEKVSKNLDIKSQELRCYSQDLSCGLLVVLATPKWLATMRIGDGFIVIQQPESEYQLLFDPIRRESANKTTFLPANNASELMQFKISEKQELIFASTDILQILALDIGVQSRPNPDFFDSLKKNIISSSEDETKEIIKNIFKSKKINKNTEINKTFLLFFYKSPLAELIERDQLLTQEVDRLNGLLYYLHLDHQKLTEKLEEKEQQLSYRLSENNDLIEQLTQANQQLSTLQSNNHTLNQQLDQVKQKVSKLDCDNQSRSHQLATVYQNENQLLTQELDNAKTELWQKGQQLNIIKKIAITSTIIATALAGLSFIQYQERNQLIRQIEQIRRQNNLPSGRWDLSSYSLDKELENLGEMIEDEKPLVSRDLDELINKMQENKETSINELNQRISNLEAIKTDLENQNNSRKNRINELVNQNNSQQNRINELVNQNNSQQNRINELVNQNQSLQNRIKELEGETTTPGI